jgi:hypothetical protein
MKTAVVVLVATSVLAGFASQASAVQKRKYKHKRVYAYERSYVKRSSSDYTERNADKLQFGSQAWMRQMEAEGRFGGNGAGSAGGSP